MRRDMHVYVFSSFCWKRKYRSETDNCLRGLNIHLSCCMTIRCFIELYNALMPVISVYLFIGLISCRFTSSHQSIKREIIVHHCCCMDRVTGYGSSDRESMSLALKVNIIRRPDDQLEINISDGLTARATWSSWFDRFHKEKEKSSSTSSTRVTVSQWSPQPPPIYKSLSCLSLGETFSPTV